MTYSLSEKVKYGLPIDCFELVDALNELETWQDTFECTPSELKARINDLEENESCEYDKLDAALVEKLRFSNVAEVFNVLRDAVETNESVYAVIVEGLGRDCVYMITAPDEEEAQTLVYNDTLAKFDRDVVTNIKAVKVS